MNLRIAGIYFLIILFFLNNTEMDAQRDKLIYVGDPMCSWCYGFTMPLQQVKEKFPHLEFTMVMGGLRAGGQESMSSLKTFLREHWYEVHEKTGQPFAYGILSDSSMIYNTEPACRAVVTVRKIAPEKEYAFFKALQRSFYAEGTDITQQANLIAIAQSMGIDKNSFLDVFQSQEIKNNTKKDFMWSENLEVNGFPSLILYKEGRFSKLSTGYSTYDQIVKKMETLQVKPYMD